MFLKLVIPGLLALLPAAAQMRMTVEQLQSFVRSSIQLKHEDRRVADFLRKVKPQQRVTDLIIEELQGDGAGPKTVEALRELRDATAQLRDAPKPVPKPQPGTIPPPSSEEQAAIVEKVRSYALDYDKGLPNFICTQVTRRFFDPTGLEFWQRADVVTARLSYFEHKEEKKVVLVNNQVLDIDYDKLGGTTSTGEFGSLLRQIFLPESRTRFDWERWATLRGRRNYVFHYRVPQQFSQWRIIYDKSQEVVPGYHGLIFVDRDLLVVNRVTLEAENIPPAFPVQKAGTLLDYETADISGASHLLPLRAVVQMRSGKVLVKNEVEFRMYRRFGADTSITFDTPEPLAADQTQEQPSASPPAPSKK